LWADGVFMSMPFLVRYGKLYGDSSYANDEATKQLIIYASHLNDPETGLMFHAYDESGTTPWSDPKTKHSAEFWCHGIKIESSHNPIGVASDLPIRTQGSRSGNPGL
jgi:unsaturated rhamnogalacturonyl hydrolase